MISCSHSYHKWYSNRINMPKHGIETRQNTEYKCAKIRN